MAECHAGDPRGTPRNPSWLWALLLGSGTAGRCFLARWVVVTKAAGRGSGAGCWAEGCIPTIIPGARRQGGAHSAATVCLGTGSQPALLCRTSRNAPRAKVMDGAHPRRQWIPSQGKQALDLPAQSFLSKAPDSLRQGRSQAGYWQPAHGSSSTSESKARVGLAPLPTSPSPGYHSSSPCPAPLTHPVSTLGSSQQTASPAPSEELGVCGKGWSGENNSGNNNKEERRREEEEPCTERAHGGKCVQAWTHLGVFSPKNPWPNAVKSEPDLNSFRAS